MGADELEQMMLRGEPTTMDDIVEMTAKPKELSPLAKQLLTDWQGLGTNVGIGSAGTDKAEIGGRSLADVAEDFAQRLSKQGVTDITQAKFKPGSQAAWTAEGKGNVSLVATEGGKLIPVWGSSSDASKIRNVAIALGSAWFAPGLSAALGGGFAGAAGAGAILGGGRAALTGGDVLKGALTGGLTGGIGYGVSSFVDPFAADIGKSIGETAGKTVGEAARGAVSGAARSAVGAGLTGGSVGDALLTGAVGGGVSGATGDLLSGLPKDIRGPVTAAVSAGLLGKDPTQAAIMSYAGSLLKGAPNPFSKTSGAAASAGYGGADPGYFDPDAETSPLPAWALDPYATETEFLPASEVIRERQSLEDRYPAPEGQTGYDVAPKTSMSPQEMARFLEANIDDPGSIDMLMQEYYPELYRQQIGVTGKREVSEPIYEQAPTPAPEPIYEQPPTPAPSPASSPGKAPGAPSKPSAPAPEFDPKSLLAFFAAPPKPAEEPYSLAQTVASPYGTIYDTYGGNDMQDLMAFLRRG